MAIDSGGENVSNGSNSAQAARGLTLTLIARVQVGHYLCETAIGVHLSLLSIYRGKPKRNEYQSIISDHDHGNHNNAQTCPYSDLSDHDRPKVKIVAKMAGT